MKKYLCVFLSLILTLLLSACKQEPTIPTFSETVPESTIATVLPEETAAETTQPTESIPEEGFSFSQLKYTTFCFSSGAGAWRTTLNIQPDGSFSGVFHDSNMGDTGEGYPNGSVSRSDFTGRFSQPVTVNEHTYSVKLEQIDYQRQPGTEEILDGTLYYYTDAYGLAGSDEFLIYLPGAPLEVLPEYFLLWVNLANTEETELPFYGLYDPAMQNGFSSYSIVSEIRDRVAAAEAEDIAIDTRLQEAYTQADMNIAANERYQLWDGVLNELWAVLKQTLDEESMRRLTTEELAWIEQKEQAVADAGAEVEGGTLYPTVTAGTAARITKERVYELLELLP